MYSLVNQRFDRRWPTEGLKRFFKRDLASLYVAATSPPLPYSINFLENIEPENNPQVPMKTCFSTSPSLIKTSHGSLETQRVGTHLLIITPAISQTKETDRKSWES